MKKILALVLVLCMVLALAAACGDKTTDGKKDDGTPNFVVEDKDETKEWPDVAGFFDPTFDYDSKDTFKVGYLVTATNFLYDEFDKAFADWSKRMNINYTGMHAPAGGSAEEYLSMIETFADQGYNGLLLDADLNLYAQVIEVCNKVNIPWISCMGQARDSVYYTVGSEVLAGTRLGSSAGFADMQFGVDMMDRLIQWKEETYPDVPWDKVGVISVDFSLSPQLHERSVGAEKRWSELNPTFGDYSPDNDKNPKNFFVADTSSGQMDQVTAQNLVTQYLSNPGDIEIWLIPAAFDDFSVGAANAAENLGITDTVCTVSIGGSSLIAQWDSGADTSWRYANFLAQTLYAEPLINALWAYMSGQATPETIWPDWVKMWDKGDKLVVEDKGGLYPEAVITNGAMTATAEHNYASLLLPTQWLSKDMYKEYLEWCDLYVYGEGASGHYKYENEYQITDLDLYSARVATVPDSYYQIPA